MKTFHPLVLLVMSALMVSVAQSQTVTDSSKSMNNAPSVTPSNAGLNGNNTWHDSNLKAKEAAAAKGNEARRTALANARISAWEGLKSDEGDRKATEEKPVTTKPEPAAGTGEKPALKKTSAQHTRSIHPAVKTKAKSLPPAVHAKTKTVPVKKVSPAAKSPSSKVRQPERVHQKSVPGKKTSVAAQHAAKPGVPLRGKKTGSPKSGVHKKPAAKAVAVKKAGVKSGKVAKGRH